MEISLHPAIIALLVVHTGGLIWTIAVMHTQLRAINARLKTLNGVVKKVAVIDAVCKLSHPRTWAVREEKGGD